MSLINLKNVHPMDYQTTNLQEIRVMKQLNEGLKLFYDEVESALPESADKTVTLRKCQELRMQLNCTIALNGVK